MTDYAVGATAWIFVGNHSGTKTPGKVIHKFDHEGRTLYVMEIDTGIDPVYETREWAMMAKGKNEPLGFLTNRVSLGFK